MTDTTADSLTLSLGDNVTQTAITAAGEETITLNNAATAASATSATVTTLSAAALKTLNITGLGGMTVTNAITNGTALATVVDSHTGSGNLSLDLSSSTVATTFTGGSSTGTTTLTMGSAGSTVTVGVAGAATVTGGVGADNITGSNLADSLSGGSGADTLVGGIGDDTLSGGAGNDSISGGEGADALSTDSGADTIDGGTGTDTLTVSAGFTDLSLDTITLVETVVATTDITMSVAQHAAFTTITTSNAITLADAGAVTGKSAIATYNLANGTNTFTASSTAVSNSVTGGSGSDTFNFGQLTDGTTQSLVTDTIIGGAGTDTLNITGNVALTATLTNVSGIENIVLANTSTAVSLTLANGNVAAAASMTIDGSSMTTAAAILTVNGAAEADGSLNIIGGNAADILTGGGIADTITGGLGADSITGGGGDDTISLTEAVQSIDTVVLATTTNDSITGYSIAGGDILKFIDGGADLVGAATKGFAKGLGTALGLGATDMSAANVIVVTDAQTQTGTAIQTLIAAINAGAGNNIGDGVYIISAGATGNANVWYDGAAANTDSVQVGTLVGIVLADLANLVTANFSVA